MKSQRTVIVLVSVLFMGCVQAVQLHGMGKAVSIPDNNYTLYQYSGGPGDRFRAVLLKDPGTDIEVVPFSIQITAERGTLKDALNFMRKGLYSVRVEAKSVVYQGKTIGYLLTYPRYHGPYYKGSLETNIFERGGKIHFSVDERFNYGD